MLAGLGDPGNHENLLGLTGSAALDPHKLDTGTDLDLLVYPPSTTAELAPVLASLGAQFLDELPEGDPRLQDYQRSRIMPPLADPATSLELRRRRRDVCWIDGLRLDLTDATGCGVMADSLPYHRTPADTDRCGGLPTPARSSRPRYRTSRCASGDALDRQLRLAYSVGRVRALPREYADPPVWRAR